MSEEAAPPSRSVLSYHGGKFRLASWIVEHLPAHKTYVEPFCGGSSVLMAKQPSWAECINDLDGEIVSLFRVLRDPSQARELRRLLELTPYARTEFEQSHRALGCDPIEAARRLMVRSFMGIGTNSNTRGIGQASTGWRNHVEPNGSLRARSWAQFPAHLDTFTHRLRNVVIDHAPALSVVEHYDALETCFFLDPPYPKSTRSDKGDDYRFEMSDDDHRALAATLHGIKGMAILSGYGCPLYDELFGDWEQVQRIAYSHRNSPRLEVLWLNPAASQRLAKQQVLFAPDAFAR